MNVYKHDDGNQCDDDEYNDVRMKIIILTRMMILMKNVITAML